MEKIPEAERLFYCAGAEKVSRQAYRVNGKYIVEQLYRTACDPRTIGIDVGFSYGAVDRIVKYERASSGSIFKLCQDLGLDKHKLLYFPEDARDEDEAPKQLAIDQAISISDSLDDIYAILLKQADLLYELLMAWKGDKE